VATAKSGAASRLCQPRWRASLKTTRLFLKKRLDFFKKCLDFFKTRRLLKEGLPAMNKKTKKEGETHDVSREMCNFAACFSL
jgi:hypothetical protein